MSGRSLLAASFLLLLALGTAAPGAAQVIEEPHWRRAATDDGGLAHVRPAEPGVDGDRPGRRMLPERYLAAPCGSVPMRAPRSRECRV